MRNKTIKEIEIDEYAKQKLGRFYEIYDKINELVREINKLKR